MSKNTVRFAAAGVGVAAATAAATAVVLARRRADSSEPDTQRAEEHMWGILAGEESAEQVVG